MAPWDLTFARRTLMAISNQMILKKLRIWERSIRSQAVEDGISRSLVGFYRFYGCDIILSICIESKKEFIFSRMVDYFAPSI